MSAHLDEQYYHWLYVQVCSGRLQKLHESYKNLFHILFTTEFVWIIPNDDNRVEDGKELRYEFLDDTGLRVESQKDHAWIRLGCSFLEMLLALSRRADWELELGVKEWFFEILDNLELSQYNDSVYLDVEDIQEKLNRVNWRTYNYNGGGGMFPLVYPEQDQREVEIWYQLNTYILERGEV